jgi:hypothetical protein
MKTRLSEKISSHRAGYVGLVLLVATSLMGCKGSGFSFPQSLGGLGAPARVPAPATGSFQVPGSYSANPSANNPGMGNATQGGLNSSSFNPNANKSSQVGQPVTNLLGNIHNAQNQFRTATHQALDNVNRTAENVSNRVDQASARVDRFNSGVIQASAILSDAATAPIAMDGQSNPYETNSFAAPSSVNPPSFTVPSSSAPSSFPGLPSTSAPPTARVTDSSSSAAAPSWRAPSVK